MKGRLNTTLWLESIVIEVSSKNKDEWLKESCVKLPLQPDLACKMFACFSLANFSLVCLVQSIFPKHYYLLGSGEWKWNNNPITSVCLDIRLHLSLYLQKPNNGMMKFYRLWVWGLISCIQISAASKAENASHTHLLRPLLRLTFLSFRRWHWQEPWFPQDGKLKGPLVSFECSTKWWKHSGLLKNETQWPFKKYT